MLTVYSGNGSPGASTTALYLAAQWASTGTEVLLIEADPGGGSLSHHLGVQFTPGSASLIASGLPVRGGNLIDHSQDVLFNSLHVMPSTSSPTGARQIVTWLEEHAAELRAISESEMAVIVDAGRITPDSAAAPLTTNAAGVLVVARGDTAPTSLEHIGSLLPARAGGQATERCVATVGDSPLSAEEWRERCDVTFCGSIVVSDDVTGDLSAFLNRNKRKHKKWRLSLEATAGNLLPCAKPPASGVPRPAGNGQAEEPAGAVAPEPDPPPAAMDLASPVAAEPAPVAPAATHGELPHEAPVPQYGLPAAGYGAVPPPEQHFPIPPPPAIVPYAPPGHPHHLPEAPPPYYEPPPPPEHAYHEAPPPPPYPEHAYHEAPPPHPAPPPPPAHPGYHAPPEHPPTHRQHAAPPWPPAGHGPAPEPPPGYQPHEPHAPVHEPPPPVHEQHAPVHEPHPPVHEQHAPVHEPHPAVHEQHPLAYQPPPIPAADAPPAHRPDAPAGEPTEAAPVPEISPSGSFRDWAARLHGQAPQGTSNSGHGGAS